MKTLVIYDSNFGNTKLIAEEVANNIDEKVITVSVKQFNESHLEGIELLIIGSPIVGWKPTEAMLAVLDIIKGKIKKGQKFTTFDTRVKLFIHGDAKNKIANILNANGAELIFEPQAFIVKGKKGPLLDGELEKAANWAKLIRAKM